MRKPIALLAVLVLSGCATAYKENGFMGGFSTTQLDENVFQISFRGNGHTSDERAADFALLRGAEVALERGYEYFVIVDSKSSTKVSAYTTPTTTYGTATASGNYAYGTTFTTGGQTNVVSRPTTSNTIACFREKPEGFSYNARYVQKSLREKYKIMPPTSPSPSVQPTSTQEPAQ